MKRSKIILLALAGVALLAPVRYAGAQSITPAFGDLILGFRAGGGVGGALDLEVDLGSISNFYDAAPNSTFTLPQLAAQDLIDTYGASWNTRTDLFWGAVSTTGRVSGYDVNPKDTLWATAPNGAPAWQQASQFAQGPASANIEPMYDAGSPGTLNGATPTTNSASAAVLSNGATGSWGYQDTKTTGTSFGYFNPTVDNSANTASGPAISQLYQLQPGSGAATLLGNLILGSDGTLSFQAVPEPSAGVLVLLGLGSVLMLRRRKASRV